MEEDKPVYFRKRNIWVEIIILVLIIIIILLLLRGCYNLPEEINESYENITINESNNSIVVKSNFSENLQEDVFPGIIELKATAFNNYERIPDKYTCDQLDINPALKIYEIPDKTVSMTIIMEDPDAPLGVWTHWVLFNLEPERIIDQETGKGIKGVNSWGDVGYRGPCPPSGSEHNYEFRIYALDKNLALSRGSSKEQVLSAMQGHVIDSSVLIGIYSR